MKTGIIISASSILLLVGCIALFPKEDAVNLPHTEVVADKKSNFFNFITPLVQKANQNIIQLRQEIINDDLKQAELIELAETYKIKSSNPQEIKQELLIKVQPIPKSLVISQAAIESNWGLSRFAQEGNNLFGQQCYQKGCGLLPKNRPEGKTYEVKKYSSALGSIEDYMLNLNRHTAYEQLRQDRQAITTEGNQVSGCILSESLNRYSEIGQKYSKLIKSIIKGNQLEDQTLLASCH